jgi:hypothetical protein
MEKKGHHRCRTHQGDSLANRKHLKNNLLKQDAEVGAQKGGKDNLCYRTLWQVLGA